MFRRDWIRGSVAAVAGLFGVGAAKAVEPTGVTVKSGVFPYKPLTAEDYIRLKLKPPSYPGYTISCMFRQLVGSGVSESHPFVTLRAYDENGEVCYIAGRRWNKHLAIEMFGDPKDSIARVAYGYDKIGWMSSMVDNFPMFDKEGNLCTFGGAHFGTTDIHVKYVWGLNHLGITPDPLLGDKSREGKPVQFIHYAEDGTTTTSYSGWVQMQPGNFAYSSSFTSASSGQLYWSYGDLTYPVATTSAAVTSSTC